MFGFLGSLHPALYMMVAVVAYSAFPVLFSLGSAGESPFLFTGIYQGSTGVALGAVMLLFKRRLLPNPAVIEDIRSHFDWKSLFKPARVEGNWTYHKTRLMLASTAGYCGFVLFALGLAFVDVSVAAILYETWPLFWILVMSFLFYDKRKKQGQQRYGTITASVIFGFLAFAGVALVILSHNDNPQPVLAIGSDFTNIKTLVGVIFVLLAAICVAAIAGASKIGEVLAKEHSIAKDRNVEEVVFVIFVNCICLVIASGVLCVIGLVRSETISSHQLLYATLIGLFVNSIGIVALRVANKKTKNLGVNALAYATPLVTLLWLWMLSILDVMHLDYLIIGAMGIVAANVLINAKADKRIAYGALVVSLWVFGTFIYFHDGYATDVPLELPVTVFILVLSFRVDRLVRRTAQEEAWVFEAFRRLESLAVKRQISRGAWGDLLLEIDRHETQDDLTRSYENLARYLAEQMKEASKARGAVATRGAVDEIAGIRHLVDNLAHSRQQGAHFGEIVAIGLTGTLIIAGLLVFNGEREVYGEITSFVLSSVLVFLFFNILDLQRDRRDKILEFGGGDHGGEYIVKFDDNAKNRKWQQWISVVTSAVIVIVFAWLLTGA